MPSAKPVSGRGVPFESDWFVTGYFSTETRRRIRGALNEYFQITAVLAHSVFLFYHFGVNGWEYVGFQ